MRMKGSVNKTKMSNGEEWQKMDGMTENIIRV